jgi:hypothetical protein
LKRSYQIQRHTHTRILNSDSREGNNSNRPKETSGKTKKIKETVLSSTKEKKIYFLIDRQLTKQAITNIPEGEVFFAVCSHIDIYYY